MGRPSRHSLSKLQFAHIQNCTTTVVTFSQRWGLVGNSARGNSEPDGTAPILLLRYPLSSGMLGPKRMVGHLENYARGCLRYHPEDKRVVIRKIVTPTVRHIDASTIETRYIPLVVSEESAP